MKRIHHVTCFIIMVFVMTALNGNGQTGSLLSSVSSGNYEGTVKALEGGAAIESAGEYGDTPLMLASLNGQLKIAGLLIEKGADINATNIGQSTALHLAADKGHMDIARLLISKGALLNVRDRWGRTPLYIAALNGRNELVMIFIAGRADVNMKDNNKRTPLYAIARRKIINEGHIESAKLLIQAGADVNSAVIVPGDGAATMTDYAWEKGKTPLYWAAFRGHKELVSLLILNMADLSTADIKGDTPLHMASYNGKIETVKLLLKGGAPVNAVDIAGDTPLILAVKTSFPLMGHKWGRKNWIANHGGREKYFTALDIDKVRPEIVSLLVARRANVKTAGAGGMTALHWAAYNGFTEIAGILIRAGAAVEARDTDGMSSLYIAVREGHTALAKMLIERGAKVDIRIPHKWSYDPYDEAGFRREITPLHWSALNGMDEVTRILVDRGAKVNIRDRDGMTPLYLAAREGDLNIVEFLLSAGADPDIADDNGLRPLEAASDEKIITVLAKVTREKPEDRGK